MADEWNIDQLDLGAYLRRIDGPADAPLTVRTLADLHRAHLAAIPFENVDVVIGRGVSVELNSIQSKLVDRRRGGYCYEHALLFAAALERLGFPVDRLLARIGSDLERPRARTHMTLRVQADDAHWLADVGFGSGLLEPLPFGVPSPHGQGGWTFALAPTGPGAWQLRERRGSKWVTLYSFDDQPQHAADVVMANHFTSTYRHSPFVGRLVVVRKDADSTGQLIDRRLTVTRPDRRVDERQLRDHELPGVLRDDFGLILDPDELARLFAALPESSASR